MRINLDAILRSRLSGWKSKLLPRPLTHLLERIIHQDELNAMLDHAAPTRGTEFSQRIYRHLDLSIEVTGEENIPAGRPLIFASNHPLGGLDGIGLIAVLGARYGDEHIRFIVNDMLMNVEPLSNVFLPVNKYGAQGRAAAKAIQAAHEDPDMQIGVFPAGLVSRLHDSGEIKDLKWQKSFVQKAIDSGRDIVPIHFEGLNRPRFYKLARWRKKLGIKINIEQAMLPAELCAARGNHYKISFLPPVTHYELIEMVSSGKTAAEIATDIQALL
ncbi:MAG: 1-acyl-sn-glycerol-3-phosphate acyltransferase [Muribaculaceae bacterium]|nr:1-acyl-sn-glycerol-3-phosphate acyltransferase [Muribaculaceae bacterium]